MQDRFPHRAVIGVCERNGGPHSWKRFGQLAFQQRHCAECGLIKGRLKAPVVGALLHQLVKSSQIIGVGHGGSLGQHPPHQHLSNLTTLPHLARSTGLGEELSRAQMIGDAARATSPLRVRQIGTAAPQSGITCALHQLLLVRRVLRDASPRSVQRSELKTRSGLATLTGELPSFNGLITVRLGTFRIRLDVQLRPLPQVEHIREIGAGIPRTALTARRENIDRPSRLNHAPA
jgi:hypothetical protein